MKVLILFLFITLVGGVELPSKAQAILDTLEQSVVTAKKKAVADLTVVFKEQMRLEKLDAATAVKAEIDKLNKDIDTAASDNLIGASHDSNAFPGLIGKWSYSVGGDKMMWEFKSGGTVVCNDITHNSVYTVQWEYRKTDNVIHIKWNERVWDEIILPLDIKSTKCNNHFYGKSSGTLVKLP